MNSLLPPLRALLGLVETTAGRRRALTTMGLILAAGLTDGIGLVMLVPLLESLDRTAPPNGLAAKALTRLCAAAGLPLTLPTLILIFLMLVASRAVMVRSRDMRLTDIRLHMIARLRVRLYRAIAHASWPFLSQSRSADLSAALITEVDRVGQGTFFALQFPARALTILVHLAVAFLLAPELSLLALATGVLLALAVRRRMLQSLTLGGTLTEANRDMHREVSEFLGAIKVTKSHAAEDRHVAAFGRRVDAISAAVYGFFQGNANARFVQELAGAAAVGGFLWAGSVLAHLPTAQLLLLVLVFYRLLPLTQEVQQSTQQVLNMLPSLTSVLDLCRRCEEHAETGLGDETAPFRVVREIDLKDVWYAHAGAPERDILRGVDLTLPAGGLTVLYGPSGIGKSTVLDLLVGLMEPRRGTVLVDGRPRSEIPLSAWRRGIAYVPQESFLFHDTIRANLLWARPEAGEAELREALHLAAADFVHALPRGLETVVGDRGLRLSGGERQRLALARALLRQPGLLILDEATAALDAENERLVIDAIHGLRGRMIVVAVTHRPNAFRQADQVVTLADGRIHGVAAPGLAATADHP